METTSTIPRQSLIQLFLRFLRFGSLAWGGPVAQIAMIKRELVDEEKWISREQFNRAYAIYQVLPGPEAHELCVYFGTLARGRIGGLLAGLGFMLPGFVLMFGLSWFYVRHGIGSTTIAAIFVAIQAAVLALIVRAVHRIGSHALTDRFLWGIGIAAFVATLWGVHFAITLVFAGLSYEILVRRNWVLAGVAGGMLAAAILVAAGTADSAELSSAVTVDPRRPVTVVGLFWSGLRSGLLTFGGAYTVIPYLLHDSVNVGGWMTREQFLDGVALGGILPAPLIIFSTFVGYVGRGALGALAMTAGIFLPAFGFTMLGHEHLERALHVPRLQRFLSGVTAGVVGLIAATTVQLAPAAIGSVKTAVVFGVALALLYLVKHRLNVLLVIGIAAASGALLF